MVDGGSSSIEDGDRSDVVRSLMGNPWPPACPTFKTEANSNKEARTNRIGGTWKDKGGGNTSRDGQTERIVMGIQSVEGPHPGYNRTLKGVVIFCPIQPRGRRVPKVRMHIHDATDVVSRPRESGHRRQTLE